MTYPHVLGQRDLVVKGNGCKTAARHTLTCRTSVSGYMWLHIRGVGEWTNRLHNYFEKEQEKLHNIDQQLPGKVTTVPSASSNGAPPVPGSTPAFKRIQA